MRTVLGALDWWFVLCLLGSEMNLEAVSTTSR